MGSYLVPSGSLSCVLGVEPGVGALELARPDHILLQGLFPPQLSSTPLPLPLSLPPSASHVYFLKMFYYSFIWLYQVFTEACRIILLQHVGSNSLIRDQTWAPCIGSLEF